jgi:hypothetical protein
MGMDGGSHNTFDAIGRRRFDRHLTAADLEARRKVIRDCTNHRRLISEPIFKRLGIGKRRFAIAEQAADLGTMTFGSPPRQVQRMVHGRWEVNLLRDRPHHLPVDLRVAQREPAALTEEQQQHGKAQPVGTALGRDRCVIGWRQGPPFGEVRALKRFRRARIKLTLPDEGGGDHMDGVQTHTCRPTQPPGLGVRPPRGW